MLQRFDIATVPVTPWKNGGGSTREIVCHPPGAGPDAWNWRISIATIDMSGPFSAFPDVDRVIMLLDGDGVLLQSADGIHHRLDQFHAPFAFPGEVALHCTPLGGASTDFNVMTRRSSVRAEVRVLRSAADIEPATGGLLLACRGHWELRAGAGVVDDFTAGRGLWWDAAVPGWQATPQQAGAVLICVRLENAGACKL